MWVLHPSERFLKQLKKIRKTPYRKRAEEALRNLQNAGDPVALGIRKHGEYSDAYSYEIGASIRLIYNVDLENKIIKLIAIGSHKEVYGND